MKLENSLDNFLLQSVEGFVNLLDLPIIKYPDRRPMLQRKNIVAQGLLNGKSNTSFIPDSWDLRILSEGKPRFLLRSRGGQWMELLNPALEYLETMKAVMVAAHFLTIAKKRSNLPKGDVWRGDVWHYIWEECRGFKVKPDGEDLNQSSQLIRSIVLNNLELQHSSILAEFFPALSYEKIQQEVLQGNVHTRNMVPVYHERSRVPEPIKPGVVYKPPSAPVSPLEGGVTPSASSVSSSEAAWFFLLNSIRQATQGPAPEAFRFKEVNPTPIAPITPPEAPGSSSQTPIAPITPPEAPGSSNLTPIASVTPPEAPGSSNQTSIAALTPPEALESSRVKVVSRTPIAAVTPPESGAISSGGHEDERPERNLSSRSELPPVTDIPREATLAKDSSTVPSRLGPTPNSATPAPRPLDLLVEVSEREHLGDSGSGDEGKGVAVEDRAVEDSEGKVREAEASAVRDKDKGIAVEDRAAQGSEAEGIVDPFPDWVDEPDVCSFCDDGVGVDDHLLCCDVCMRSFHTSTDSGKESNCQSLGLSQRVTDIKDWVCPNCAAAQHQCFACGVLGNSDPTSPSQAVFECDVKKCKRFYHPQCVVQLLHIPSKASDIEQKKSTFSCPLHRCIKCKKPDQKHKPQMGLVKCRRCPRAWHEKCLPKWDQQKRLWELEGKFVLYCGKHKIDKNLGTPKRDHILFPPSAVDESGRENQQASGSKEPASGFKEPASRSKEPASGSEERASRSKEPASGSEGIASKSREPASRPKEPASDSLGARQPSVQGFMADAWKAMTRDTVREKKRAHSSATSQQKSKPNVKDSSEALTLERAKKKRRLTDSEVRTLL